MTTLLAPSASDTALEVDRRHMRFETDGGTAARAAVGLIVLASDQTIEHEFRKIFGAVGVGLYQSRIFNANAITPETLKEMEAGLTEATAVILPGMPLDVVAYACTSGAMVIGDANVAARVRAARPKVAVTSPLAAARAAFKALGISRVALLTPYMDEINQAMRRHIMTGGVDVPVMGSFNESDDTTVARISPASVRRAAYELGKNDAVEAVFVACTSLRVVEIARELEDALGKPVTSSNHALAWHCLRLAGIGDRLPEFGRLFSQPLA